MYSTLVAPYFDPDEMDTTGPPKETAPGICYTLWLFENDVTTTFTGVVATGVPIPVQGIDLVGAYRALNAVDGYACIKGNTHYYHTKGGSIPLYFELRSQVNVKVYKIIIKPRSNTAISAKFTNV